MSTQAFNLSITRKTAGKWRVKLNGTLVGYVVKVADGYEPRSPGDGVPFFRNVLGDKVRAAFACVALFGEGEYAEVNTQAALDTEQEIADWISWVAADPETRAKFRHHLNRKP